jgi:hypothetical protein
VKASLCAAAVSLALTGVPVWGGEVGVLISGQRFGEFDAFDAGLGLRGGYRFGRGFALEAELEHLPGALGGRVPFSASRTGARLRARAGIARESWGAFAGLAPGVLRFGSAPEPIACIAVFPPPLECQLAAGKTVPALGLGGGLELFASGRVVVRLDVEDLLLRYPVSFRRENRVEHHARAALSFGLRLGGHRQ